MQEQDDDTIKPISVYLPTELFELLVADKTLWTRREKYLHDTHPRKHPHPPKSKLVVKAVERYLKRTG